MQRDPVFKETVFHIITNFFHEEIYKILESMIGFKNYC